MRLTPHRLAFPGNHRINMLSMLMTLSRRFIHRMPRAMRIAAVALVLLAVQAVWGAPSVFAAPMWAFEDQLGVLHLSDRKLDHRYVRVDVPVNAQKLGFDHIRQVVRDKKPKASAAAAPDNRDNRIEAVFGGNAAGPKLTKTPGLTSPGTTMNDAALRVLGPAAVASRSADLRPATAYQSGFRMWPPVGGSGGGGVRQPYQKPNPDMMQAIKGAGRLHGVEPELIYAVIETESNFQTGAISPKGAQGLMQIMPQTGRDLGLAAPFDPARNIEAGTRYLRAMYDRFGDARLALAAYNAGPANVEQHRGIPPFAETQQYVVKVLDRWKNLKSQGLPAQ
jgi:hypothetical protein